MANVTEAWNAAAHSCNLPPPPLPPDPWLVQHYLPLLAALIPVSLAQELPLPPSQTLRFLSCLHRQLAQCTSEILRRRQELMAAVEATHPSSTSSAAFVPRCPLPSERQFTVADLRQLETQRRAPPHTDPTNPPSLQPPNLAAPTSGVPRRRWLRERLIRLIVEDTVPCPAASGAVGPLPPRAI